MYRFVCFSLLFLAIAALVVGCNRSDPGGENSPPDIGQAKFVLASEPAGAKNVIDVKKEAKDGDEVVVLGRIGGSKTPFFKDRVSFTIVDPSFVSCDEMEGWK